ncbi:MAG TPA: hypothetical protein VHZ25_17895 [Acidobacteriaceae bacterium]|jgi:hypothetical protein|nr:hypothetical protein [Acidobacteriaceae bacterium]
MNGTDVNVVLTFVVVISLAMALGAWVSPQALRWITTRTYARACALEASRNTYRETYKLAAQVGLAGGVPQGGK